MNCCVIAFSLFSSDSLTRSANSLYSVQWHKIRGMDVENEHIMETNFAKTLVWKHDCDVKLWRNLIYLWADMKSIVSNKQHTPSTYDSYMPLNEPPWKFSAYTTDGRHTLIKHNSDFKKHSSLLSTHRNSKKMKL